VNHDSYTDDYIRGILESVKTVAIVGASPKDVRPSFFVLRYLIGKGYRVFPVNPGHGGQEILGQTVYASLADIPEPLGMVEVFRGSEHAPRIVEEALALNPRPKVIWMQLGVSNDEAAPGRSAGQASTPACSRRRSRSSAKAFTAAASPPVRTTRPPDRLRHPGALLPSRRYVLGGGNPLCAPH
jgi:predicted CoA-binding protein